MCHCRGAMTVEFPCHRERQRGDPLEKMRGKYSVLYSNGSPRSLCSFAMTVKQTLLSPKEETKKCVIAREQSDRGKPTEELTAHIFFTSVVGYFATLNMTCFLFHSV